MSKSPSPWAADPLLRWLRALAIVAAIAFIGILILDPARTDLSLLALLVGALTLWLGYEGTIRLPDVLAKRNGKEPDEPKK